MRGIRRLGAVAQLARAAVLHTAWRGFESLRPYSKVITVAARRYVDLRIECELATDDGHEYLRPIAVHRLASTTASEPACDALADSVAQSDFGQIDVAQALLSAIDGTSTTLRR